MTQKQHNDLRQILFRKFSEKMPGIEKGSTTAFLHLLSPQPPEGYEHRGIFNGKDLFSDGKGGYFFPKRCYNPGETIYVREEWAIEYDEEGTPHFAYKAGWPEGKMAQWKAASYMPLEAARFFLQVTETDICRIGEIRLETAKDLGAGGRGWRKNLQEMWDGDLRKNETGVSFLDDPWVQVVHFRRVGRPEGMPTGMNEMILAHGSDYKSYTIRLAATGELVAKGTARECAKAMGYKTPRRVYTLLSHVLSGINRKYTIETTQEPRTPRPRGWLRGE